MTPEQKVRFEEGMQPVRARTRLAAQHMTNLVAEVRKDLQNAEWGKPLRTIEEIEKDMRRQRG